MARQQFNSYVLPKTADFIRIESERTGIPAGKIVDKAVSLYCMEDINLFNRRLQEYLGETEEVDIDALKRIKAFLEVYIQTFSTP